MMACNKYPGPVIFKLGIFFLSYCLFIYCFSSLSSTLPKFVKCCSHFFLTCVHSLFVAFNPTLASLHLFLLWSSTISAHDSRSANMAFSSRFSFWEQKESLAWIIYTLALHDFAVSFPIFPHSSLNECS